MKITRRIREAGLNVYDYVGAVVRDAKSYGIKSVANMVFYDCVENPLRAILLSEGLGDNSFSRYEREEFNGRAAMYEGLEKIAKHSAADEKEAIFEEMRAGINLSAELKYVKSFKLKSGHYLLTSDFGLLSKLDAIPVANCLDRQENYLFFPERDKKVISSSASA